MDFKVYDRVTHKDYPNTKFLILQIIETVPFLSDLKVEYNCINAETCVPFLFTNLDESSMKLIPKEL